MTNNKHEPNKKNALTVILVLYIEHRYILLSRRYLKKHRVPIRSQVCIPIIIFFKIKLSTVFQSV